MPPPPPSLLAVFVTCSTFVPPERARQRHAKGGLSAAAADRANGSSNADGDGGDNDEDRKGLLLPPEGPKLSVVCYSRSPRKSGSSGTLKNHGGLSAT